LTRRLPNGMALGAVAALCSALAPDRAHVHAPPAGAVVTPRPSDLTELSLLEVATTSKRPERRSGATARADARKRGADVATGARW
jgi:hypothetical protein